MTKACKLRIGDVFSIVASGQVVAVAPIADGKAVQDQTAASGPDCSRIPG